MMVTPRALSRSATSIAQAAVFMSPRIFPPDRDQDWSKLTTIEEESRALLNVITRRTHYT
jgi:hypothetical protein